MLIYCAKKENVVSNQITDSTLTKQIDSTNLIKDSIQAIKDLEEVKKNETVVESNISINEISNLPSDIDGCGSYFSTNKSRYNTSNFIYVDNTQNAYMNINGDLEMFEMLKNTANETLLSNEKYNIHITSKKIGSMEEGAILKGNIEVTSKINSEKKNIEFYGGVGC